MLTITKAVKTTDFPSQWDAWTDTGQYLYLRYRSGIGTVHQQPGPYDTHADEWNDEAEPVAKFGKPEHEYEITLAAFCRAAGLHLDLPQAQPIGGAVPSREDHLADENARLRGAIAGFLYETSIEAAFIADITDPRRHVLADMRDRFTEALGVTPQAHTSSSRHAGIVTTAATLTEQQAATIRTALGTITLPLPRTVTVGDVTLTFTPDSA